MSGNITIEGSTFEYLDVKNNFSTLGIGAGLPVGKGTLSAYAGVGTEFEDKTTGLIFDLKGSMPYGKSDFSGGFRLRNNINGGSKSLQFRAMPIKFSTPVPVGDNTKFYVTPYLQTKLDYKTGKFADPTIGGFAGFSTGVAKNTRIFVEGQLYDVTDVNSGTTSINAGITITI